MVLTNMRHVLPFLAILLLAALPAVAQGILPNSFAGWTATSKGGFAPAPDNSPESGATVAAAKEYNFVSGEQGQYTKGAETLRVVLYQMKDPSGAYGEYSYLRTPDMPHSDLTAHSCMSPERALILTGNLVLDIRGNELPRLEPDLKSLVVTVGMHAKSRTVIASAANKATRCPASPSATVSARPRARDISSAETPTTMSNTASGGMISHTSH